MDEDAKKAALRMIPYGMFILTTKSKDGQTPLQSTEADAATTKVAAGFLQLKLDQKTVDAGRIKCIELLKKKTAKP